MLSDLIDHHVKEEESSFFPHIRRMFDEDELVAIGDQIQAMKDSEKTSKPATVR